MSRISTAVLLAMLVLAGAMGLKTVVTTHGDGFRVDGQRYGASSADTVEKWHGTGTTDAVEERHRTSSTDTVEWDGSGSADTLVRSSFAA